MGEWKYSYTLSYKWQLKQKSGHFHNLSASSPRKKQFVPIRKRVNPRASLDDAEKRKISPSASTRTNNPSHPVWGLDNTSSEHSYIAQVVRRRIKKISHLLFYYT